MGAMIVHLLECAHKETEQYKQMGETTPQQTSSAEGGPVKVTGLYTTKRIMSKAIHKDGNLT